MKQRRRIYYTETQKALMWERWRKGDTLHQIAQLFDRHHSSIQGILTSCPNVACSRHVLDRTSFRCDERREAITTTRAYKTTGHNGPMSLDRPCQLPVDLPGFDRIRSISPRVLG